MPRLLEFFLKNPVLAVVVVVWVVGIFTNIAKSMKKARERAEASARRQQRAPAPVEAAGRPAEGRGTASPMPERTAAEIAREMRRILGVEPAETESGRGTETERPDASTTPPALPVRRPRPVIEPERPPTPVVPTTAARRLPIHVDPHVGEGIQKRASVASVRVAGEAGNELGGLGGRVRHEGRRRSAGSRYALDDLKHAIVLNEILGPPLALRSQERG